MINNSNGETMETILQTGLRTVFGLFLLFIITRMMGKKQVSQMNIYDYIIGITMGSIAADISLDIQKNIVAGIISLIIYGLSGVLVTYLTLKNIKVRRLINGVPTVLIDKGKIISNNLKKEGIDINDLEEEARQNGYFDLSQVNYAVLEISGKISFLAKSKYENVTREDMKIKATDEELKANIIIDGVLLENNLRAIGKDKVWLDSYLKKSGYNDYDNIILMTASKKGKVNIFPKTSDIPEKIFE